MNLSLYKKEVFKNYTSNSQRMRILTENWFLNYMYCPCCLNKRVKDFPNNQKGSDFFCEKCKNEFQLKSSKKEFKKKVLDGEYNTMKSIILNNKSPNFFLLNYSKSDWIVKNLILIPKFFISFSMLEKRKPLSKNARRAGWIGCNFLLNTLPSEGKIYLIKQENVIEKEVINKIWKKMFFLNMKKPEFRGWTSDTIKVVEELSKRFSLNDIYKYENYFKKLHPNNRNIKPKIRQQLQILRDNKIINFLGNGNYAFNEC